MFWDIHDTFVTIVFCFWSQDLCETYVHLYNAVAPNRTQVPCRICLLQSINSTSINVTLGVIQKFS